MLSLYLTAYQSFGARKYRFKNPTSLNYSQRKSSRDDFPYLMASEQNPPEGTGSTATRPPRKQTCVCQFPYICPGAGRHSRRWVCWRLEEKMWGPWLGKKRSSSSLQSPWGSFTRKNDIGAFSGNYQIQWEEHQTQVATTCFSLVMVLAGDQLRKSRVQAGHLKGQRSSHLFHVYHNR